MSEGIKTQGMLLIDQSIYKYRSDRKWNTVHWSILLICVINLRDWNPDWSNAYIDWSYPNILIYQIHSLIDPSIDWLISKNVWLKSSSKFWHNLKISLLLPIWLSLRLIHYINKGFALSNKYKRLLICAFLDVFHLFLLISTFLCLLLLFSFFKYLFSLLPNINYLIKYIFVEANVLDNARVAQLRVDCNFAHNARPAKQFRRGYLYHYRPAAARCAAEPVLGQIDARVRACNAIFAVASCSVQSTSACFCMLHADIDWCSLPM